MRLAISEILIKVSEAKTKKERIELLRQYDHVALRQVLRLAYDPSVKWALPEGTPDYKPSPYLDGQSILYAELKKLYLFLEGGHPTLSQAKREQLYIQFLEYLDPKDAELMIGVKDHMIPFANITKSLVKEAFPGLLDEQESEAA